LIFFVARILFDHVFEPLGEMVLEPL